jgi:3',5'-cyclic AMP phosphodiesterase CpdA
MRAPGYRIGPLVVVLAIVALVLALSEGWFSGSDTTSGGKAFVSSDARGSVRVWAVGDGPDGGPDAAGVARLVTRANPDRILYLGDVYEHGTQDEFTRNVEPLYGKIAERIAPTPGNHDWPGHASGYDVYWKRKHGVGVQHYYSFTSGGWQILSLNSEMEHGAGSPQIAWLRSKVKGNGTCRLAFWHRPRFSAGDRHGDQPDTQPFWDALEGRAAIVVNGHEHDMQRFKPRNGITEFASGAGGHGLYAVDRSRPGLAFSNDDRFGALQLDLTSGLARYRFVSVQGDTLDSGKVRCNAG